MLDLFYRMFLNATAVIFPESINVAGFILKMLGICWERFWITFLPILVILGFCSICLFVFLLHNMTTSLPCSVGCVVGKVVYKSRENAELREVFLKPLSIFVGRRHFQHRKIKR